MLPVVKTIKVLGKYGGIDMIKAKPPVGRKKKPKVTVLHTEPKGMKLGDLDSVKKGSVDLVDGIVLVATGFLRLLGFALSTVIDGMKWIFQDGKKKPPERFVMVGRRKR